MPALIKITLKNSFEDPLCVHFDAGIEIYNRLYVYIMCRVCVQYACIQLNMEQYTEFGVLILRATTHHIPRRSLMV